MIEQLQPIFILEDTAEYSLVEAEQQERRPSCLSALEELYQEEPEAKGKVGRGT